MKTNNYSSNSEHEFDLPGGNINSFKELAAKKKNKIIINSLLISVIAIGGGLLGYKFLIKKPPSPKQGKVNQLDEENFSPTENFESNELEEQSKDSNIKKGDQLQDLTQDLLQQQKLPNKEGSIKTLAKPKNLYFIIVNSFVDQDLAMDQAKKLAKNGVNVCILYLEKESPLFYRLAINQGEETLENAKTLLRDLKPLYKEKLWIIKY